MSEQKRGKKRSKSYYKKCAAGGKKSKSLNDLDSGMKGFLVTCNKYERETVREMYNLLNEYADKIYGPEKVEKAEGSDSDGNSDDDMEKALEKERTELIKQATTERRFQNTDTKFKNLIFIRTTLEDPCSLAHQIFTDMVKTQTKKARYAQRLIPVSAVCRTNMKNIEPTIKSVLQPHFETPFGVGLRYTTLCKIRNNTSVSRTAILPMIGRLIQEMNPLHTLCHDDSQLVVIVEVIRNNCCISVVKDYFTFKKYNFHEVVKPTSTNNDSETVKPVSTNEDIETDKPSNVTTDDDEQPIVKPADTDNVGDEEKPDKIDGKETGNQSEVSCQEHKPADELNKNNETKHFDNEITNKAADGTKVIESITGVATVDVDTVTDVKDESKTGEKCET